MEKIELYLNNKGSIIADFFSDIDSEYEDLVLQGNQILKFIKVISKSKIIDIYENPNDEDITLEYKGFIVNINEYEKLFSKRELNPILVNLKKHYETKEKNKIKNKKISRKNKYIGRKIIASGLVLLCMSSGIGLLKGKSKPKKENSVTTSYSQMNEDQVETEKSILFDYSFFDKSEKSENIKGVVEGEKTNDKDIKDVESVFVDYSDRSNEEKVYITNAYYSELINKYSRMYGLDNNLVTAIATQERGIHSPVVDEGGATGLMQIQNEVWLGKTIDAYNFQTKSYDSFVVTSEHLSDVETNIKLGCMVLQDALQYTNYNILAAIQCYNMGIGNMETIIGSYAIDNNTTIDKVLSDEKDTGWLDYRYLVTEGDQNYIENVLSWLGSDLNIKCLKSNGEFVTLKIQNEINVKKH